MKLQHTRRSFLFASLFSLLAVTIACDKDEQANPIIESGKATVLHGSFGNDSLDFFVDNKKVNSKLVAYGAAINYIELLKGENSFEAKTANGQSIVKKNYNIEKNKNYSILLASSADGNTKELIQVTDDLTAPGTDKAKIRLIQLSPNAGKLNLQSGSTKLAENVDFKAASAFVEVNGQKTTFEIVDPTENETLLTIQDLELAKGKIYTIWVVGLKDSSDTKNKLKANVFVNK